MSKAKCKGACCKHVAEKISQVNMPIPCEDNSQFDTLYDRVDESKRLADLYRELGEIHGQYAEDVELLLFENSEVSINVGGLAPLGNRGNAGILSRDFADLIKPNRQLKNTIKKAKRNLA